MPKVPLDSPREVLKSATRKNKRLAKQAERRAKIYERMRKGK